MRAASQPQEYIGDAADIFISAIGREKLTAFLAEKLGSHGVKVFHGTRVSAPELAAIEREGLKPLDLINRKSALVAEFRSHPDWSAREHRLDATLHKFGPGWMSGGMGQREDGSVHVCLSRSGLTKGCNHYLTLGAEVDNLIADELFPDGSGKTLLQRIRDPKLISFDLTFPEAEAAANPYECPYERLPFIAGKFFGAWAFRLSTPEWEPAQERDCFALRVPGIVMPGRLTIEALCDADLEA
jgi:hypothetical protein